MNIKRLAWKQIIIAFLLGGFVGVIGVKACVKGAVHRMHDGRMQSRMLDTFSSKLDLTPEQRAQVAAIFEAKRVKMDALRAEIKPKFEELRTSTSAEIRQVLTPEQLPKFDAMEAEWQKKVKRFRDRWTPPPPGGGP